jgi:hypothetical protein
MKITILETSSFKTERTKMRLNHDLKKPASSCQTKPAAFLQITTDMLNRDLEMFFKVLLSVHPAEISGK